MPQQDSTTTINQPMERIDLAAVKLAAKKAIVPGATDTHGVEFLGALAVPGGTAITVRVFT